MRYEFADRNHAAWLDHVLHWSVVDNSVDAARHRAFIFARAVVAASILFGAPIWCFFYGMPSASQALLFLLAQAPLASIVVLARVGDLRLAQSVSIFGWLALAVAVHALTDGFETISIIFLTISLVEAALTPEIVMVFVIEAATMDVLALTAGRSFSEGTRSALAPTTTLAIIASPLLLYIALIAVSAIRTESARLRAEARNARDLRLLTDALGDIVLHLDRSGAVKSLVGDVHKTYALDRRDLIGRGFFQRVHIADRPAFLKLISDACENKTPETAFLRVQVSTLRGVGSRYDEPVFRHFDARVCSAPQEINGDSSEDAPVVCILRDVTAAKQAEEALAAARAESERATASKTRFLANVSHELRTPLNAIIGFSEMLANTDVAPTEAEKQREYAEIIASSGHHLLEVVNTILDMSKIESGAMHLCPEPYALPALIDQCCDMIQLKADQSGVTVLRDYPKQAEEIIGDKRAVKQILINLLSNAVKFTPAGGKVRVRLAPEGNSLALTVADSGIGIAANDLERIGDPFFQASSSHDRAYEGTGLGLSVVRGLVGLHGGSISVESAPRRGTSVTVRLPLDCRDHANRNAALARIETVARHGAAPELDGEPIPAKDTVKKIA